MSGLVQRNLKIYFKNHSGIVFSILGALISFVLYLVFLKDTMTEGWSDIPNGTQLLDLWLIGGTLAVTAITSTLAGLSQMVDDGERNVLNDITLVGLKEVNKNLSYVISGSIIGTVMQLILFAIMLGYFSITDQINIPWSQLPMIILTMVVSAICLSLLFFIVISFIKRKSTLGKVETILGTAAGFLACVYIPLGILPDIGQNIIKLTPAIYLASLYRRLLMTDTFELVQDFMPSQELNRQKESLGLEINWGNFNTTGYEFAILIGVGLLGLAVVVWMANRRKAQIVQ